MWAGLSYFPNLNIRVAILPYSRMGEVAGASMQTDINGLIPVAEYDGTNKLNVAQSLPLNERMRQKIATVRWKELVTTTIIILDLFLLYASISLIGVFFPAEVRGDSYVYIAN